MRTFQEIISTLSNFWASHGCIITQPYDVEKGAGTSNPTTFLRSLGPEPYNAAYIEPCRRPKDGRYGENPNRLQHYYQYQVILKPSPDNIIDLYLTSLQAIGLDIEQHDIRFVHDDWENPTLGAWGLGWEVWIDGMEMTQFTYFQAVAGIPLHPITGEITYGIERIAMSIQKVDSIFDIQWNDRLTYGDLYKENEIQWSHYNFSHQNDQMWMRQFHDFQKEAKEQVSRHLPIPAYDFVMKASHAFNMLDAKGVISVSERASYISSIREIAKQVAEEYLIFREQKGFPLLKKYESISKPLSPAKIEESTQPFTGTIVVEIGVEELPATFVPIGIAQFEKNIRTVVEKYGIKHDSIEVYGTPRRLVFIGKGFEKELPREIQERKGPPIDAIWEKETFSLSEIGRGFFASTHLFLTQDEFPTYDAIRKGEISSLSIETVKGVQYLFLRIEKEKRALINFLQEKIPQSILSIQFPKSMKWGEYSLQFARPIRWILALLDHQIIPFQIEHIYSSHITFGSRSLKNSQPIPLFHAQNYMKLLEEEGDVIIDPKKREEQICNDITQLVKPYNAHAIQLKKVLRQVVYLVEKPFTYLLSFDKSYLDAPKEVLIAEMVEHQKYFPVESLDSGELLPYFIIVSSKPLNQEIEKGNKKVLSARLKDGLFLWNEDRSQSLELFRKKLHNIIYQTGAGTLFEKTERIYAIAQELEKRYSHEELQNIEQASFFSKSDLSTQLVAEFPELQGIVGSHLAQHEKLPLDVACAIQDHWLPNQDGGNLPRTHLGDLISISDKLDTLVIFFSLNMKPTSSHDPFALRRAALGIIRIGVEHRMNYTLQQLVSIACKEIHLQYAFHNPKEVEQDIIQFILGRMKAYFLEKGYCKESIDAVLIDPFFIEDTFSDMHEKIATLDLFKKENNQLKSFQELMKRCLGQISHQQERESILLDKTLFTELAEKELFTKIEEVNALFSESSILKKWKEALSHLLLLQEPIHQLFNSVKILSDIPEERNRRISLLLITFQTLNRFADMKRFLGFK